MAVKLISVHCPDCGHSLDIEEGRTKVFCSYCGAQILMSNENEYIVRHVDEAGVKQAETERLVRLKELEIVEKQTARSSWLRRVLFFIWLTLVVVFLVVTIRMLLDPVKLFDGIAMLIMVTGPLILAGACAFRATGRSRQAPNVPARTVRLPDSLHPLRERRYRAVCEALAAAGFENISCVCLHDLDKNSRRAPALTDRVASLTVNGRRVTKTGGLYPRDAAIIVMYHGE